MALLADGRLAQSSGAERNDRPLRTLQRLGGVLHNIQ